MIILAPASAGDVIDRLTILRIKAARIADPAANARVRLELDALQAVADRLPAADQLAALEAELFSVNLALWDIEDAVRDHERDGRFDAAFIEAARSVYRTNDRRAALKRRINLICGSDIVEEKSYADWAQPAERAAS